jgi:hypothetical protein
MPEKMQPLARTPVEISEHPLTDHVESISFQRIDQRFEFALFTLNSLAETTESFLGRFICSEVLNSLVLRVEAQQFAPNLARMFSQDFMPVEDSFSRLQRELLETNPEIFESFNRASNSSFAGQYPFWSPPFRDDMYQHNTQDPYYQGGAQDFVAQTNAEKLAAWGYTGEIPDEFLCYITSEIMTAPVVVYPQIPLGYGEAHDAGVVFADGITLDRGALERWLQSNPTDPRTRAPVNHGAQVIPNVALAARIQVFMDSINPENSANRSMIIR